MRVALVGEGTRGDVHPLLALGGWLRARGHQAVLCAPPDFEADAEAQDLAFRPIGDPVRDFLSQHAHLMEAGGLAALRTAARWMRARLPQQFQALRDALPGCDLVLGGGVTVAAASVTEALRIPYRYLAYCPILLPSRTHPPFFLQVESLPPWLNRLAWLLVHPLHDWMLRGALNHERAALGLAPVRQVYRQLLTERPVLAADAELAPLPPDVSLPVDRVPCLHPRQGEPLPVKLYDFLEAGPPPVYFGFGSMTDPDPARTTRTVLRVVERLGCRALVSRGWAGLGEGPLPEGVATVGSVSHARLFPRCAAVVHHGGAGTTTTAARSGVPQVLVPHVADQFYWARRVRELGLGPPAVPRARLTADRLHAAVASALEAEVIGERALDLGARLRAALPEELDQLPERLGIYEPRT